MGRIALDSGKSNLEVLLLHEKVSSTCKTIGLEADPAKVISYISTCRRKTGSSRGNRLQQTIMTNIKRVSQRPLSPSRTAGPSCAGVDWRTSNTHYPSTPLHPNRQRRSNSSSRTVWSVSLLWSMKTSCQPQRLESSNRTLATTSRQQKKDRPVKRRSSRA